ncbi:MAG: isoprenylcysteine carboxylmethyltransferase family protein [Gammaproteobacteria bacterium]
MLDISNFSNVVIFFMLSILLVLFSWRSLKNFRHHGFYRFFAFEGILIVILINAPYWVVSFSNPLRAISDSLLLISILFVWTGYRQLKAMGGKRKNNGSSENFNFENTENLVSEGVYKYIRHPMYSSLIFLTWGVFLKHITPHGLAAAVATTLLTFMAVKTEEKENKLFFGEAYKSYIKKTKMFIPFIY